MSKYGDYVLITDSTCDLTYDIAKKTNLEVMPMVFLMEDKVYNHYLDCREMSLDIFYNNIRRGIESKTTQISYNSYLEYFEKFLKDGKDILYVCFTSGLSGTFNTSRIAARDLKENYPDRKITILDSKCASIGQGLLMYYVANKFKNDKPDMDELAEYTESLKMNVCHWFVVDDIEHLKRGGRISAVTATFAKALQIKPMLSLDDDGKLVNVGKVRGANNVYDALVKKMQRDGFDYGKQTVFIGHADNIEGAKELKKKIKGLVKDVEILEIGPVIGTHVGTGMLALTFTGERNLQM
ncbi:MAG: DegV family protein [Ruminococcus sp.]|nr:DegV family protein [Ruminococcus sp.]